MKKLGNQPKKRRIINLCLVGVCILIALGVVIVDYVGNLKSDATLTVEQAQAQINDLLTGLPTSTADCSKYVVENTKVEVLSVEPGNDRNFVVKVRYETLNVLGMYTHKTADGENAPTNKDLIFEKAWKYAESVKADGKKVNATLLQIEVESYIL